MSLLNWNLAMQDIGFTHIALPVKSIEKSIAFYAAYAGLKVIHRREDVAWISDQLRPFAIVLIESDREISPLSPMAHLGIALASHAAVDAAFERARSDGIVVREPTEEGSPVGYWGFIRDPDGHTLELSFGQLVETAVVQPGSV